MTGIYIHIPFCIKKCAYCDFNSYSGIRDMSYSYGKAVISEIKNSPYKNKKIDTVYIGGGTPTCIDEKILIDILASVRESFDVAEGAEITVECNPGTADFKKLHALQRAGFNRLSIGCQSADDKLLEKIGRIHNFDDFTNCFQEARRAGFENISVDLMFGLPGQTAEIWRDTLRKITELGPEHISAYSLKIEEGTLFFEMKSRGELSVPDDDANREMYDTVVEFLKDRGYCRYEISNFSKAGFESRHNLIYWTLGEYIGFGAGAHSFVCGRRFSDPLGVSDYIDFIGSGGRAEDGAEMESEIDMMCEFMFLGLRLDRGVSESEFKKRFGKSMGEVFKIPIEKHLNVTRTLESSDGNIKIRPEYTYVSNLIMSDFIL